MANKKAANKSLAKRPAKAPKKRPSKPAASLPEPIDVAEARIASSQRPEKPGILEGLSGLFSPRTEPSDHGSPLSSIPSLAEPLSPESERLLAAVPDTIGGEADDPGGPADVPGTDPIAALMASVAFEPQDVQDTLCEFFDWLSERFKSDHWILTERQARMLGRPAAQLANSLWARLQAYLPDILGKWCEETPGAMAFILACGIVVVPKVSTQMALSRQRAQLAAVRVPSQPRPVAVPAAVRPASAPAGAPRSGPQPVWGPQGQGAS